MVALITSKLNVTTVKSLSVFFPAFNEEESIVVTVKRAKDVLIKLPLVWEIVIVDDGSSDKTPILVDELAKRDKQIKVIHQKNGGYGMALRTGLKNARYDWIVYTDADGQFDFSQVTELMTATKNADAVWGYRVNRRDSVIRLVTGFCWLASLKILFGLNLRDVNCGFKLIRRDVLTKIGELTSTRGGMINAELAIKIKEKGFKIVEVGVSHFPRIFGTPTGLSLDVVINSYYELLKMRLWGFS